MFVGALILVVIVILIMRPNLLRPSERTDTKHFSTAEEILKERYARGEISAEECRSKLSDLRGGA